MGASMAEALRSSLRAQRSTLRALLPYAIGIAALALAAFLLSRTLAQYSLDDILKAIRAIRPGDLGLAALFAAASYVCLTFFDVLALRYVGHRLPYRHVAWASFTALSLGHNIGFAGASSGAIRYRFYSRWGLGLGDVARLVVFCGMTVALGLVTLGGLALLWQPRLGQSMTGLPAPMVTALGVGLFALTLIYAALAAIVARPIRISRFVLPLPPLRLALAQIGIGTLNYLCVAGCLHSVLRQANAAYADVAAAYVIANVAAIVSHVPGGVGVIEAVVGFLLPGAAVIGGLVMFRTVYYLVPLVFGLASFAAAEIMLRGAGARASASATSRAKQ